MREIDFVTYWLIVPLILAIGVIIAVLAFLWLIGHPPPSKGDE